MLVAYELGKFEHEVAEELTLDDLARWIAFFDIMRENEQKDRAKRERANTRAKATPRVNRR